MGRYKTLDKIIKMCYTVGIQVSKVIAAYLYAEESPNTISFTELWAVDNVDQYKQIIIYSRDKLLVVKFRESAAETILIPLAG